MLTPKLTNLCLQRPVEECRNTCRYLRACGRSIDRRDAAFGNVVHHVCTFSGVVSPIAAPAAGRLAAVLARKSAVKNARAKSRRLRSRPNATGATLHLAFFADLRAKTAAAGGPPPLGLHVLMGKTTPEKVQNMIDNISKGRIAPVELIARKL